MWELDYKESWAQKNWCFWTVVLEKTLETPLDFKEFQPVHPKGDQSWVFIGKTDVEAGNSNTLATWCEELSPLKRPWWWKDWGQEKGTTEDEMVGWHHRLNGLGFGWTLGVGDGQGGLACCSSWGRKESDTTERLNWATSCDYFSGWEMMGVLKKLVLVDHEEDFSLIHNSCSEMVQGSIKVPMTPSGVIWSQKHFHSGVKLLFACFMVLAFGLVVKNQWCVELQVLCRNQGVIIIPWAATHLKWKNKPAGFT